MLRLAVIGFGRRSLSVIQTMRERQRGLCVAAVADPDEAAVRQRCVEAEGDVSPLADDCRFFADADAMLAHADAFDGVIIGTPCHLHAQMACKVAATTLPLFLEKPVAITRNQLEQLAAAFKGREHRVLVSFPLRGTPLFTAALDIVRSDRLGTINQIQASNNVPYGGCYFSQWYRDYDRVGGLWLQKATHDFDCLNLLVGARPVMIAATASQRVYGGDKPHDLYCSQCDERENCLESDLAHRRRGDTGGMTTPDANDLDHPCCFSREIRNQDAGAAMLLYENGVHVSYAQNFVTRRSAGKRGAIITGHRGTLEFDWPTETIRVIEHQAARVDEIKVSATGGHSGGDEVLVDRFIDMMRGQADADGSFEAGLMSAAMCLAARESASRLSFVPVVLPGEVDAQPCSIVPATEVLP